MCSTYTSQLGVLEPWLMCPLLLLWLSMLPLGGGLQAPRGTHNGWMPHCWEAGASLVLS